MSARFSKYILVSLGCTLAAAIAVKTQLYKAHLDNERRNSILSASELQAGAVVETIGPDSEARKADLREGDVLLHWSQGKSQGEIRSPFDLSWVETEQRSRGLVTLKGLRNGKEGVWRLGPNNWGIEARPNLRGGLLSTYQQGQNLAKAGKLHAALGKWRNITGPSKSDSSWLDAWLFFHAGGLSADEDQWTETDAAYQAALEHAKNAGSEATAQVLRAWGQAFEKRSDWTDAENHYRQAIVESRKVSGSNLVVAANLNHLGNVARQRGDLTEAEAYYRQALVIRQKLAPGSLAVAGSLNNLAVVAFPRGDLVNAEEYLCQGLDIQQKLAPGSLIVVGSLTNLGIVANLRGDLVKAEEYHRQALVIQQKVAPGSLTVANLLTNLAVVAYTRGDLVNAEEYHRQALAVQQKLAPGSLDVARTLNNLGMVANGRGDLIKAEEYHRQALAVRQKLAPDGLDVAASLTNLGIVANLRGDLVKAEEYLHQGLVIQEKLAPDGTDVAENLHNLGKVARQRGELSKAEEYQQRALDIYKKVAPGSEFHAETLADLAEISLTKQQWETAAQRFDQTLAALESQTARIGGGNEIRSEFRAQHASYYSDYIAVLMKQHKPELAFQVLERSRAQSLREMLANARINIRQGVDPGLLERERSLQSTINIKADRRIELTSQHAAEEQVKALTKEIEGLLGQYEELEGQIRLSSPSFAALTQPKPLSAKEVQLQLLDSDTLLLEYALGEKHSYIFVLTPTSLATYELPKRAEIETAARQVYASVTNGTTKYPEASGELSRMVLGPAAAQLAGKRLLIVGDGALEYVPFAILPVPRKPGLHLANGNRRTIWLIEEHEIVYSPSASVLISLRHEHSGRKPVPGTVAVLADPVFTASDSRVHFVSGTQSNLSRTATASGKLALSASLETGESRELRRSAMEAGVSRDGSLSRLPYTRKEAEAITTITGPKKTVEHLDFDASRENALSPELQDVQIVHFATHGLIDTKHPELSGLVFSLIDRRGQPQDGFLRLSDIYNLRLNADLVVLSACSTALGKEIKGEGLVGLTRGFLYAGASHVVASLWEINDFATAELMEHFYRAMRHDGLTPAAALRAAQIHMLHEWQFPYYWAAFELQGDWR